MAGSTTQAAVIEKTVERPTAAFVLSLIAGLCILAGSAAVMTTFPTGGSPYHYGGMMGGYYGGMMGSYYGMMNGLGFGGGGMFYGLGAIGLVSGIIILIGAAMIYSKPAQTPTWGTLILAFSIVSFIGMGGFFLGAILGVVGGALALSWKQ